MGKYYRGGKLISADTFTVKGERTLAGATAETLWADTTQTTRPTPSGEQLHLVSSSAQDDAGIPETTDVWTVTVGGAADAGDVARITVNGTNYDYAVGMGATTAIIATGLGDALTHGSTEKWTATPGGNLDVGDTYRIEIDGVPYNYTVQGGDALATLCTALANVVNTEFGGNAYYTAVGTGTKIVLTAKAAGPTPNVIANLPNDPLADTTFTAACIVAGVAADTNYTATVNASVVTLTNNVAGVTADTVAASYPTDAGANSSCTAVHTTTGAAQTAGTGVQAVQLDYLDGDGNRQSETIPLNGTSAVATVATDVAAILALTATAVGSSGGAVGTVTVKDVADAVTFDKLPIGANATACATFKVPARNVAWLVAVHGSASTATTVRVKSDCNPSTGAVVANASYDWASMLVGASQSKTDPAYPIGPFPAGATIRLTGTGAANPAVLAVAEGYLEPA